MNGIDALFASEIHDAVEIEIRFDGPLACADQVRFIGFEAVQGEAVFLGVDSDSAKPQFIGGAEDTDSDFAAIEGEQFFHGRKTGALLRISREAGEKNLSRR